jgi:hypothetical protein
MSSSLSVFMVFACWDKVVDFTGCDKHGGASSLGCTTTHLGRLGWRFLSHVTVCLEHGTGADGYSCPCESKGLAQVSLFPLMQLTQLMQLNPHVYTLVRMLDVKYVFCLKVKNKPHDGCTELCIFSQADSTDANRC